MLLKPWEGKLSLFGDCWKSFYCLTLTRVFTSFATVPFIGRVWDDVSDIQTWCVYKTALYELSKELSASTLITLYGIYVVGLLCFGTCLSSTVDSIISRELLKKEKVLCLHLRLFLSRKFSSFHPKRRHLTLATLQLCFVMTSERSWRLRKWVWKRKVPRSVRENLKRKTFTPNTTSWKLLFLNEICCETL